MLGSVLGLRNASIPVFFVCLGLVVVSCGSIVYSHRTHTHAGNVTDRVPFLGQALGLC